MGFFFHFYDLLIQTSLVFFLDVDDFGILVVEMGSHELIQRTFT